MAKTQTGKPTWSVLVQMQLSTLTPAEQVKIRRVIDSETTLRRLAKTADRAGPDGCYFVVNGTPDFSIVFEVASNEVKVLDLISKRVIDALPTIAAASGTNGVHSKSRRNSTDKSIKV